MKKTVSRATLLAIVLTFLVACAPSSDERTMAIPNDGVVQAAVFERIRSADDIGIFNGQSNGIGYQWLFMGALIGEPKDTNLAVTFSNTHTEQVKSQLETQHAQEFSFGTSGDISGGTLSIFLSEPWPTGAAEVYSYNTATETAELIGSAALENTPNAIVTFSPTVFKGLYYVVAVPGPDGPDPEAEPSSTPTTEPVNNPVDPYTSESTAGPKDRYQTDPVPEGKPKPVEPGDVDISNNRNQKATLSIRADTILKHMDQFNKDKLSVLPKNGVVMSTRSIKFAQGESVFDVLKRETRSAKIHLEYEWTPMYNSAYIEGINNLYEFDCGELSGWMYKVNGWFPNYGASRYALKSGDKIEWVYTCDLGRDIGGWWGGMQR